MNLWGRITGSDITQTLEAFELRAKKLPTDDQTAWEEIKANLWQHSDFT